jgi:hypothetical protein
MGTVSGQSGFETLTSIVWHVLSDFMHSTDLIGWDFVSAVLNGSFIIGVNGIARLLGHPL